MKLELDDLVTFATVAESGSFAAAARVLELPTSTISRRVADYERRVGATLLRRSTRALSLTEAGRRRLEIARPLLEEAHRTREALSAGDDGASGTVRVTATAAIGQYLLAPIFASFLAAHPRVRIEMRLTEARVPLIADGVDMAVRMGALEDSELLARRLIGIRRMVVGAPALAERCGGGPERPGDLATLDCIVQAASLATWRFANEESVTVRWRLASGNVLLARQAALDGCGFALLPEFLVEQDLIEGRLVRVLRDHEVAPATATLVSPRDRYRSTAVRALSDAVVEAFSGSGERTGR